MRTLYAVVLRIIIPRVTLMLIRNHNLKLCIRRTCLRDRREHTCLYIPKWPMWCILWRVIWFWSKNCNLWFNSNVRMTLPPFFLRTVDWFFLGMLLAIIRCHVRCDFCSRLILLMSSYAMLWIFDLYTVQYISWVSKVTDNFFLYQTRRSVELYNKFGSWKHEQTGDNPCFYACTDTLLSVKGEEGKKLINADHNDGDKQCLPPSWWSAKRCPVIVSSDASCNHNHSIDR